MNEDSGRRVYAEWYQWARRTVSKDPKRAHAAAVTAFEAASTGTDQNEAARLAQRAASDRDAIARGEAFDPSHKSYAEWFVWAGTEMGIAGEPAHAAAAAAAARLLAGGNTNVAALAAEQAVGHHGAHAAAAQSVDRRQEAFDLAQRECPMPVVMDKVRLPGGVQLNDDEFLVTTAKDWGFSSQRIVMTTHRAIWTHGRLAKQQNSLYLTDIRDVLYRKPMVGFGSIAFETSSGHVIEALPKVSQGAQVRDALMKLVHYARNRSQQPQGVQTNQPTSTQPDKYEQLQKLAELRDRGVLSDEEFQAEKTKILQT